MQSGESGVSNTLGSHVRENPVDFNLYHQSSRWMEMMLVQQTSVIMVSDSYLDRMGSSYFFYISPLNYVVRRYGDHSDYPNPLVRAKQPTHVGANTKRIDSPSRNKYINILWRI